MKTPHALVLATAFAIVTAAPLARPAQADTTSSTFHAAAAGAIVGSHLTDSNNQPYYVRNGRHVYVSKDTANYYRAHHGNQSRAPQRGGQMRNDQHH